MTSRVKFKTFRVALSFVLLTTFVFSLSWGKVNSRVTHIVNPDNSKIPKQNIQKQHFRTMNYESLSNLLTANLSDSNNMSKLGVASTNSSTNDPVKITRSSNEGVGCITNPVVLNINDSGMGSLRQAISDACDGDTITFDLSVTGTIVLTSGELLIDKNLIIMGPGANVLSVSGNNTFRVFNIGTITPAINVTISGLIITNGQPPTDGGGNVFGGGIRDISTGTLTINSCSISGNSANAINVSIGGGILSGTGTLNLNNSTISGNSAAASAGGGFSLGGGIAKGQTGVMNITNSTISGNTVSSLSAAIGGGVYYDGSNTVNMVNSTIANNAVINSSSNIGGGIANQGAGTINIRNTIVALNIASNSGPDVNGTFNSTGYNLIGKNDNSTGFTNGVNNDQVGSTATPLNPQLGPLVNNGGTTQTHRLLPQSPALDAGSAANDPVTMNPIITDQRGLTRPFDIPSIPNASGGNGSDIGAYESQNLPMGVPVDFDGDGRSDPAVIVMGMPQFADEEVVVVGGDILARERQRIWSDSYQRLLHLRSGRGFVELPKDVQAAQWKWNNSTTKGAPTPEVALNWQVRLSSNGSTYTINNFGNTNDIIVPCDYDGDGRADAAVWTPSTGMFTVLFSSDLSTHTYALGTSTSDPTVVGDYDGDGKCDPAVYDKSTGMWSYLGGTNHTVLTQVTFGANGIPAPGDYDGDGKFDFGVQVPPVSDSAVAKFRIAFNDGTVQFPDLGIAYGSAVFSIVPGDYDGDGKTDIAQANLLGTDITWRVLQSSTGYTVQVKTDFGLVATDRTVQGDYDGDGKTDLAVFRSAMSPDDGVFRIFQSSTSTTVTIDFGGLNDYPVAFFNTH